MLLSTGVFVVGCRLRNGLVVALKTFEVMLLRLDDDIPPKDQNAPPPPSDGRRVGNPGIRGTGGLSEVNSTQVNLKTLQRTVSRPPRPSQQLSTLRY